MSRPVTASELRQRAAEYNAASQKRMVKVDRACLEDVIQRLIDILDAADAPMTDREPDGEDEVVSEDEGLVRQWSDHVGRQA